MLTDVDSGLSTPTATNTRASQPASAGPAIEPTATLTSRSPSPAAPASATGAGSVPRVTEYGATRTDWNAITRTNPRDDIGTAYNRGAVIYNGEYRDQFIEVSDPDRRIQSFTEQFNRGTPLWPAQQAILAELPGDARLVLHHAWAGCYQEMFASQRLGRVLGGVLGNRKGLVLVNLLAGDPADPAPPWNAGDVTSADFGPGYSDPADPNC
jgi:hypothetical protein